MRELSLAGQALWERAGLNPVGMVWRCHWGHWGHWGLPKRFREVRKLYGLWRIIRP
jgi:hypothetical protein